MKLFITNQNEFRTIIKNSNTQFSEANIHQLAYNKLIKKLNKGYIPRIISLEIQQDIDIDFNLVSVNNDIYSYQVYIVEPLFF